MSDAERGEVRLEIHIEASPRTVFALLTDPTEMKTWLAELVVAESRPGGRFHAAGALGTIEGTWQRNLGQASSLRAAAAGRRYASPGLGTLGTY